MKKLIIFLFLFLCIIFVGCSKANDSYYESNSDYEGGNNSSIVIETTRKIYYTVNIRMSCDDINFLIDNMTNKANSLGGYRSQSSVNSNYASITFRVKTDKLEEFLDYLDSEQKGDILDKSISSTDITSNYNRVEARLEVLNASRSAYLVLLEKAETVADIIAINTRIEEIDSEILELEMEKSSYDNLIDYSTINITIELKESSSFFGEYWNYIGSFFKGLGIAILYFLPVAFVISLIVVPIIVTTKRKKSQKER